MTFISLDNSLLNVTPHIKNQKNSSIPSDVLIKESCNLIGYEQKNKETVSAIWAWF